MTQSVLENKYSVPCTKKYLKGTNPTLEQDDSIAVQGSTEQQAMLEE